MDIEQEKILLPKSRTKGGIRIADQKSTAECESVVMIPPDAVTIPMDQHIGTPGSPVVQKGEHVLIGQKIADSDTTFSAPIHASVSGTVKEITKIMLPSGAYSEAVVIASDGLMEWAKVSPPLIKTAEDLNKAIRESGLVGLGGAAFPTHVKLDISGKQVDTLIVNAAECEPYVTSDYRECMENSWDILSGIYILLETLTFKRAVIAVESNKPEAIEVLASIVDSSASTRGRVKIMKLKDRYPAGAEKVLIKAVTGKTVPAGKLPADVGCIVMNVTSAAFLGRYMKTGMPLVTKRITVDGSAIQNPQNVLVPVGTKVSDVIGFCGGYKALPHKIIMGGPMMGLALADDAIPVLKQTNAILAFNGPDAKQGKETACIRCGRCVFVCPMSLMPVRLEQLVKKRDIKGLQKGGLTVCIECGSCSYVCPASRNLVQYFRTGKEMLRKGETQHAK